MLDEIYRAAKEGLEYDAETRQRSLDALLKIAERTDLSANERYSVEISLANAYRNLGEHAKTLAILGRIDDEKYKSDETVLYYRAISLNALGETDEARKVFDELLRIWKRAPEPQGEARRSRGFFLLEAGKVYDSANESAIARDCWSKSLRYLKSFGEVEHIHRAQSNLAYLDLYDSNPDIEARGLAALEKLINAKLNIGDLAGAATNYCNLGTYYWGKKRYERAIAYFRKDLSLSRLAGDKRELASTLGNLGMLYADALQLKEARSCLREAGLIAAELNDSRLEEITKRQLAIVDERGKDANKTKTAIGPRALCACGSGAVFSECCGKADFEPVELPFKSIGISGDVAKVRNELRSAGKSDMSRLDFILRSTPESKRRRAWNRIETHDGWVSMKELPDMANTHLLAARALASIGAMDEELNSSLGAVILSVCHLEAFINQLSFFLFEEASSSDTPTYVMPAELATNGPLAYQRATSLETKWYELSQALLGEHWLDRCPLWKEVRDLIYIRNELVHFKTNGYEQVVPSPATPELIYKKVPSSVEIKNIPHAWPSRIINRSLALWAVEVSEKMVDELKEGYKLARKSNS